MRLRVAFGLFYCFVLVVITSWSYEVNNYHWVKSENDEVLCGTSPPNKTLHAIISRAHCVSSCNHGCPSPRCQAINYWKNRHIKSPLCVIVQSWLSISSLSGYQLLEEPSYQEPTVCQRAIMVVHLLPVRPSTTGRTVISRVHCVSSCNHGCPSPPCQAINYWKNAQLCQQFYYRPCSYAVQEGCENYQVTAPAFLNFEITLIAIDQ